MDLNKSKLLNKSIDSDNSANTYLLGCCRLFELRDNMCNERHLDWFRQQLQHQWMNLLVKLLAEVDHHHQQHTKCLKEKKIEK